MWCSHWNSHIIAQRGVNIRLRFLEPSGMKADGPFGNEKRLVMHLMPMCNRAGCVRRDDEFGGPESVV